MKLLGIRSGYETFGVITVYDSTLMANQPKLSFVWETLDHSRAALFCYHRIILAGLALNNPLEDFRILSELLGYKEHGTRNNAGAIKRSDR